MRGFRPGQGARRVHTGPGEGAGDRGHVLPPADVLRLWGAVSQRIAG